MVRSPAMQSWSGMTFVAAVTRIAVRTLLGVAIACASLALRASAATAAPNVLVIVTDDQPTGMVSQAVMPNVAWLAHTGRRYSSAYVTTPLCCPSRTSLLTGDYAHNTGVFQNPDHPSPSVLAGSLPVLLRAGGYETSLVGKYLNGVPLEEQPTGFDHWATLVGGAYTDPQVNVDGTISQAPGYYTSVLSQQALQFLDGTEAADTQPWFLMLSTVGPHRPSTPAPIDVNGMVPPWLGDPAVRERDISDKPLYIRQSPPQGRVGRVIHEQMLRSLISVDRLVGDVLDRLRQSGELDSTLIVFTSDNGYLRGQHHWKGKLVPYTASMRVPLIVRWPQAITPGTGTRQAFNIDIAPTILDAAGVSGAAAMDGRSLLAPRPTRLLLGELHRVPARTVPTWASIRTRTYQYTEYTNLRRVVFREYYDLLHDPWQLRNTLRDGIPGNEPNLAALHARIVALQHCHGKTCSS